MDWLAAFLVRHCRLSALLGLASLLVPAYFVQRVAIDNSIEVWLGRSTPQAQRYREFLRRYGTEEFVLIAVQTDDALSPAALARQKDLAAAVGRVPGVDQVLSLPGLDGALKALAPSRAAHLKDDPLARNLLISSDGRTAGIVAWIKSAADPDSRRRTVDEIERIAGCPAAAGEFPADYTDYSDSKNSIQSVKSAKSAGKFIPHLVGTPLMNVHLDRGSAHDATVLLPVAAVLSVLALLLMLRNLWQVLACSAAVGASVLWTIGLMVMSGRSLNMITVTLPAILFVLAISPGLHIASRTAGKIASFRLPADYTDYSDSRLSKSAKSTESVGNSPDRRAAMTAAVRELLLPMLLSCLTNVAGFASLMITDMDAVFDLGLFASAGMLISLAASILIVPGLLDVLPGGTGFQPVVPSDTGWKPVPRPHWTAPIGAWVTRRCKTVVLLSVAALALCTLTFPMIRSENNVLNYFPSDSTIARDYAFVGEHLTGFYTLELDIKAPLDRQDEALAAIQRLSDNLARRPDVARVDHYGQFTPLLARTRFLDALGLSELAAPLHKIARRFRYQDGSQVWLRASILVRPMASNEFDALVDAVGRETKSVLPEWTTCDMTGAVLLLNQMQGSLVRTQVQSFGIAAATVLLMIGGLFWSWRAGLAAAVPNLLPVCGTFALMAVTGIRIDPATVMIASVAIGLAADDAIHYLACLRRWRRRGLAVPEAAYASLAQAGQAMAYSTVVAMVGFWVLCLAQFRPLTWFGLLTGSTLAVALVSDMVVMPAWAGLFRLWEKK